MGILGSRGSLLAGSNLGTLGISVISNAFGFDIGIDKIPDPSLKAKGIWDTFKEGWNGFKYFVKETVWDDWIVDKLGRGFLKGIVWDKGIVPAWNWIWNDALKWASQNPIVNGIVAIGGLALTIIGAFVSTPLVLGLGIAVGVIGVILWFRSLFD